MRKQGRRAKHPVLVMVGSFLLFFALMIAISSGLMICLGYGIRPRPLGWVLFIAGSVAAFVTVDRWANALPGIFGVATLNWIIILTSGHALNQPSVRVPRLIGASSTVLAASASVATARFQERDLGKLDRAACLGILSCFVAMVPCTMLPVEHWEIPVGIGLMGCIAVLLVRRFSAKNYGVRKQTPSDRGAASLRE
jgi:hypothetical protein